MTKHKNTPTAERQQTPSSPSAGNQRSRPRTTRRARDEQPHRPVGEPLGANLDAPVDALHCDGRGGAYTLPRSGQLDCMCGYRRSPIGRKLPLILETEPIAGQCLVFNLGAACGQAGLLKQGPSRGKVSRKYWQEAADKKWQGSVDRFLADAAKAGVTPRAADSWGGNLAGAVIGWEYRGPEQEKDAVLCADLNMTLAVLSRRVGDLFIANREPDYSWEALFGGVFVVSDEVLGALPQ